MGSLTGSIHPVARRGGGHATSAGCSQEGAGHGQPISSISKKNKHKYPIIGHFLIFCMIQFQEILKNHEISQFLEDRVYVCPTELTSITRHCDINYTRWDSTFALLTSVFPYLIN